MNLNICGSASDSVGLIFTRLYYNMPLTHIVTHFGEYYHDFTAILCDFPWQVSLLMLVEIGLFPLVCGWWLDVCSLVSDFLSFN